MHVEHRYTVAPPVLFDVLTDTDYLRARSERFGGTGEPKVSREGEATVVRVQRLLPLEHVPGPLRRFAGDGEVLQTDRWTEVTDTVVHGTWQTDAGSVPVELEGTHRITSEGSGCLYAVDARVKVRIPVVGRAAEKTLSEHLETLVRKELEFAADWADGS